MSIVRVDQIGTTDDSFIIDVNKIWTGGSNASERRDMIQAASQPALEAVTSMLSTMTIGTTNYNYLRLPGNESVPEGFLVQWGVDSGDKTIYFPKMFNMGCFALVGTIQGQIPQYVLSFEYDNLNAGGFNAHPRFLNSSGAYGTPTETYSWVALGV